MILNVGSSVKDSNNNLYILDEIIGQGGFGYVFKAHRESDKSLFAVKTMLPSFGDMSTEESFKNEIRSAAKVKGNNIIRYEYVHDGDAFPQFPPYIIMEYADGGTLGTILKRQQQLGALFENDTLMDIFKQLANGMKQINSCLVHRDIKPDNILLCGNTLKISDLGLSKIAVENTRTQSFKGSGTPLYMAPEAWDFSKNTIQMDIYSMGIVFYELATLDYPYTPKPRTYEDCKDVHLYSAISNLSQKNSSLSPSIISIINRMLEKSTKRRFSNWDEVIRLLDVQITPKSIVDEMVAEVVSIKNAEDTARREREYAMQKREKEKNDFCKLVYSQYTNTIISPIIAFVERINAQYAGIGKITFSKNQYIRPGAKSYSWEMNIPPANTLTINFEAILKENFTRKVSIGMGWDDSQIRTENYIPQYGGKDILGWGEIKNKAGYGFNILLLDNGELYGDWIIMNNKNNLSFLTHKERREPFSFSLQELQKEIVNVQITSSYRADFEPYDENTFLSLIKTLSFNL